MFSIKNKILVVFTGGTIGSKIEDNVIKVSDNISEKYMLLEEYYKLNNNENVEFDVIEPINILSENANTEHWIQISECINNRDLSDYKGIIITYGTDTLGYFANILSYLLYKVEIPVMIVSSTFILSDSRSNGMENFKVAIKFILEDGSKGVFVPFKNFNNDIYIHIGTRVKQISQLSSSIFSVHDEYFAKVVDNVIVRNINFNNNIVCKNEYNFSISNSILYIKPIVGMNYSLDIKDYKIVFHEMFHSGTIPSEAINLIKKCNDANILFYMGSLFEEYKSLYDNTNDAIKEGAIAISNMSQEAVISKLMVATGTFNTNEEIKDFMNTNIIGEFIEFNS